MTRKRPAPPPPPVAPVTADMPTMAGILGAGDEPAAPSDWALVAYAGAALGRIFPLRSGAPLIGRAPDVQVALLDGEVSRHHARIVLIGGQVCLPNDFPWSTTARRVWSSVFTRIRLSCMGGLELRPNCLPI